MNNQLKCPECSSFNVKIETRETRLTLLIIGIVLVGISIALLRLDDALLFDIGFFSLLISIIPLFTAIQRLIKEKQTRAECKSCKYVWRY